MRIEEINRERNEEMKERFQLCLERLALIIKEDSVSEPYQDYFKKVAGLLLRVAELEQEAEGGALRNKSLSEFEQLNEELYSDILPGNYDKSYANPAFAVACFGAEAGPLFAALMTEVRSVISCAYECNLFELTITAELLIEIYNLYEDEDTEISLREAKQALYYYAHDYFEDFIGDALKGQFDPSYTFTRDIIMEEDLSDPRYLYYYGEYITDNERKISEFLSNMPEEQVKAMSDTYVDGYIRGFETMGADFGKKSIIEIRFSIGFERMLRLAVARFESMGKQVTFCRLPFKVVNRKTGRRAGYHAVSPNPQYDYDHRFDNGLFLDKKIKETMFSARKNVLERYKLECARFAGPALVETFGEPEYNPYTKPEAVKHDEKQQKLTTELTRELNLLMEEYVKQEETSFTIISYPLPTIGDKFDEIFAETVRINTLDNALYKKIQQSLIDALDQGTSVHILGSGNNRTDLTVQLHELKEKEKETNFENCTADVNIPVGEVFTSPMLHGTNGVLHVSEAYLRGLRYKELCLEFQDGMVASYNCSNFEEEEENKEYIRENILMRHESLPIGEFAIGTNTTAFVMAQKYGIQEKLPVLIAEKTGPHFAVGDTCYSMSEDHKVYNPDGKEIIARENECSALRKTEPEKAYFNCHTDITIPYNEIQEISVNTEQGKIVLIKDGRFVLAGTETLNDAFTE